MSGYPAVAIGRLRLLLRTRIPDSECIFGAPVVVRLKAGRRIYRQDVGPGLELEHLNFTVIGGVPVPGIDAEHSDSGSGAMTLSAKK